jgi:proline racemase
MAVLAARGALDVGGEYVAESVLGTRFTGRLVRRASVGGVAAIVPAISGRAWITGFHQLVADPDDPLAGGFTLPDTWGPAHPGRAEGLLNP